MRSHHFLVVLLAAVLTLSSFPVWANAWLVLLVDRSNSIDAAVEMIRGSARSMGLEVVE